MRERNPDDLPRWVAAFIVLIGALALGVGVYFLQKSGTPQEAATASR